MFGDKKSRTIFAPQLAARQYKLLERFGSSAGRAFDF